MTSPELTEGFITRSPTARVRPASAPQNDHVTCRCDGVVPAAAWNGATSTPRSPALPLDGVSSADSCEWITYGRTCDDRSFPGPATICQTLWRHVPCPSPCHRMAH